MNTLKEIRAQAVADALNNAIAESITALHEMVQNGYEVSSYWGDGRLRLSIVPNSKEVEAALRLTGSVPLVINQQQVVLEVTAVFNTTRDDLPLGIGKIKITVGEDNPVGRFAELPLMHICLSDLIQRAVEQRRREL
jgi:hypothetical protein